MMEISQLDHLVLTVSDLQVTVDFYQRVLGMKPIEFGEGRLALSSGTQKINLHLSGSEFEPKARRVQVGVQTSALLPIRQLLKLSNISKRKAS